MNKVISQFKAYLTALLLVGGFMMLADCAQAQSNLQPQSTNGVKIPVTGAWADANQAVSLLGTAIQNAETVFSSAHTGCNFQGRSGKQGCSGEF
jgi:hypothetical protein